MDLGLKEKYLLKLDPRRTKHTPRSKTNPR